MLLSWNAKEELHHNGFSERLLAGRQACLLWARGYFFDSSGRMWLDGEIVDWLAAQLVTKRLPDLVPGMNGCFSMAVVWPETKVAEVGIDRFGTIPIYYHISNQDLVISDNFWEVANRLSSVGYDPDAVMSMVLLGCVTGHQTLLKGISKLPQAAINRFSFAIDVPRLDSKRYWMLSFHSAPRRNHEAWRDDLARTLHSVFERHSRAVLNRGWNLHIPLSGGKDSRLLAGMFSCRGVPTHAFSYGPPGNAEALHACQVADALGIPWRFVPVDGPRCLDSSLIQAMTRRVGMRVRFTAGLGAQLSLSAWSAQDVYVPGHVADTLTSGDFSRGSFLVRSEAQAVQHLINGHSLAVCDEIGTVLFPGTWSAESKRRVILSGWHFDAQDPLGSLYRWDYENADQPKFLSELRTYERFGHWMLPYYDHDLFEFFTGVPPELLYRQRLYIDTLIHKIFVDDLAALARIPMAYKGILQMPAPSWRDWVVMRKPAAVFGDWILRRATDSKRREHLRSVGIRSSEPSGPDPLDHWWYDYPDFRQSVIDLFNEWDGMHGIVDVRALVVVLEKPLPRIFVHESVPALMTLCYFQQTVEPR